MDRRRLLALWCALPLLPGNAVAQAEAEGDGAIRLRDLYRPDRSFSDLALALEGERIVVAGFMAPPLRAESSFFVLTKMPMAVCPFCEPGAPWPTDILAVYARRVVDTVPFNVPIHTTGFLELGDHVDPELGFASKVRLTDAAFERA